MSDNNFASTPPNLGGISPYSGGGMVLPQVEQLLRDSQVPSTHTCYTCHNTAEYQVLAKSPTDNTAEIQNGLYICGHCATHSSIDKTRYGLRPLRP